MSRKLLPWAAAMGGLAAVSLILLAPAAEPKAEPATTAHAASEAGAAAPGLALTLEPFAADGSPAGPAAADTREVRMVALYVPDGGAPSPFVARGRFRATWEGNLNLKLRERYAFQAEGRGRLTVLVDGKPVYEVAGDNLAQAKPGESIRLKKGANKLVVKYESPETGDASVRLIWSQKGVPPHPLPATVFTHDAAAPATMRGRTLREGRQLIADLRCTKCHTATKATEAAAKSAGFPDLAMDAPSFKDIGARLNRDWMAAWIHDPRAVRADAHMPRVFHAGNLPQGASADSDTRAADAAAFLATLGGSIDVPAAQRPAPTDVEAGHRLYTALACAACHVPPGQKNAAATPPRVSHDHIAAKFTPAGLKQYLLDPDAHYAWNPMPDFKLSEQEASALSAYLVSAGNKQPAISAPNLDKADPQRGQQLLASAGCVACHGGTEQRSTLNAVVFDGIGKDSWNRGCLAADEAGHKTAPAFQLSHSQRGAIAAFATSGNGWALVIDEPSEFAARQYAAMRCANCHPRDGQESALVTALAPEHDAAYARFFGLPKPGETPDAHLENGVHLAPDQKRFPLLTWAGEKLRPQWSAAFIGGEVPYKPRLYLRARMPAYPIRAAGLAAGLAAQHGRPPTGEAYPAPDASLVPAGQKLIGAVGGFSCVQCHAAGGAPPLAPFEAPAIDFMHMTDRLQKDYYHRWMYNPIALDPTTKMPRFADDDNKTALTDTLGGDGTKQFEAIWQYLLQAKDLRRPE